MPLSCSPERPDVELYERIVCQWLKSIHVHLPIDAATGSRLGLTSLLDDSLRNGVAVCKLVNLLLDMEVEFQPASHGSSSPPGSVGGKLQFIKRPATVHQARTNLELAFGVLRCRNVPPIYLYSAEQVLKGHSDTIWGLLYHIIQLFPPGAEDRLRASLTITPDRQGYTAVQSRDLEQSLLAWMTSLGVLRIANPPPDESTTPINAPSCMNGQALHVPPEDIGSPYVFPYIRNGTLLCDIVGLIEGQRLTGVFWAPRTRATCLSNLGRAMAALRDRKGMARWYLDAKEEVFAGDKVIILALLEDIHRYYDGVAPRKGPIKKGDFPYVDGKLVSLLAAQPADGGRKQLRPALQVPATEMWAALPCPSDFNPPQPSVAAPEPFLPSAQLHSSLLPSPVKLQEQLEAQLARSNYPGHGVVPEPSPLGKHGRPPSKDSVGVQKAGTAATPSADHLKGTAAPDAGPRYVSPLPYRPSSRPSPAQPQGSESANPGLPLQDRKGGRGAAAGPGLSLPARAGPERSGFVPITPRAASPSPRPRRASADGRCGAAHNGHASSAGTNNSQGGAKVQTLTKWLQFLGVNPPPPLVGDKLDAFCDGTLLCHIVSILSHQTLEGVEWNPKSRASMRHNMEKALSALERSKHLTLDWLFLCDDLLEGRPEAVLSLLASMKRAYQFFVSTVAKPMAEGLRGESPVDTNYQAPKSRNLLEGSSLQREQLFSAAPS